MKSSGKKKSTNETKKPASIPTTFTVGGQTFTMNSDISSLGNDDIFSTVGSNNYGNNDFNTGITFDPSTSGIFSYQRWWILLVYICTIRIFMIYNEHLINLKYKI